MDELDKALAQKLRAFAAIGPNFPNLGDAIKELALLLADDLDPKTEQTAETAPADATGTPEAVTAEPDATSAEAAPVDAAPADATGTPEAVTAEPDATSAEAAPVDASTP